MEEHSHHCNTRVIRQKTSSRGESKSCNSGNQSRLSQTALSASCLTQGEGDDSYNGGNQSWLSQTAHSIS
eukprot:9844037-Ditylum_brightwellii.AAC.1